MVHTSFKSRGHTESKILHNKVEVIFFGWTILKIFNFKVNSQALKSTPNAFKLLSNILAMELNYI